MEGDPRTYLSKAANGWLAADAEHQKAMANQLGFSQPAVVAVTGVNRLLHTHRFRARLADFGLEAHSADELRVVAHALLDTSQPPAEESIT